MNDHPPSALSLRPIAAVLAELAAACPRVAPREIAIADAAGLILAENLTIVLDMPVCAVALRSGYAVAARDLVGASSYAPLLVPVPPPWIDAGLALPSGLDAIVPADVVSIRGSSVEIAASPSPGEFVRRAGEDGRSGECLRGRGEPVRGRDVAAAIASGIASALVHPVIVQGYADSSATVLSPVLEQLCGATVRTAPWSSETPPTVAGVSLVVVTTYDRTAFELVAGAGGMIASGLALSSAETVAVGRLDGTPVIVAPPRLETLVALAYVVIQPLIDRIAGRQDVPVWRRAALSRKLSSTVGLTELALVRDVDGRLEPLGVGSLTPSTLVRADGYVIIPPESEGFQAGAMVEAYDL